MLAGAKRGARLSGSATLAGRVVERQKELGTKNQAFDDSDCTEFLDSRYTESTLWSIVVSEMKRNAGGEKRK
ncbi:hypothetical protein N7481_002971 [Penicillium waksmanii]|uniref:uncharacterized protein n=1 Tax=Penicillium waksmanii TaxID=69791 RepID=UPI002548B302|nr:uncharacterized protein N7481_002971 [Penicillium waksmanii]KAJ5987761.1 hypothetical protein N7481_002971 [Penicillium waksmanii]